MEQNIEYIGGIKVVNVVEDTSVLADEDLKEQRTSICDACSFKNGELCNSCMCLLNVKISYVNSSCPEGKW